MINRRGDQKLPQNQKKSPFHPSQWLRDPDERLFGLSSRSKDPHSPHQDADVRGLRVFLSTAKNADESQLVQGYV